MAKSATDVMQELVFSAVIDAAMAFKAASRGVPNALVRDLQAVHPNTTAADLPAEVQAAVAASVRDAFARLRREGYTVSGGEPGRGPQPPRPRPAPRGPAKPPVVETRRPRGPGKPPGKGR